jgi:hypothetical protein
MINNSADGTVSVDYRSDDYITMRDDLKRIGEQARGTLYYGWQENLEHQAGYLISMTRGSMKAVTNSEYQETLYRDGSFGTVTVANKTFPAINRLLARTLGMINGFQVTPGTADERDKDAAKAAEKLSLAQWYGEHISDMVSEAVAIAVACSHGFILQEGDATLEVPEMVVDDDTNKEVMIPVGRVIRQRIWPTDVNPLPGIRYLNDSPVLHVRQPMFEADIMRRWDVPQEVLDKAPRYKHSMSKLDVLEPMTQASQIVVDRMWWRPDHKAGWKAGKMAVIIGEEVVWRDDEWIGAGNKDKPRTCEYPIIDFSDVPINSSYWGRGRQSVARGPQKILNTAWSKASQVANLPGLMMAVPMGSQIDSAKITNAPISIIKYNTAGGRGVDWWTPKRMELYEWVIAMSTQWIDEAFSQPPPSRGESPGSRFPASGLQTLIEQAELSDTPFGRLTIDAISRLMRQNLSEGQRVWPEEMVEYVLGESGRHERAAFRKADLSEGWDMRVRPDAGLPNSRTARLEMIAKLAQFGLLGDLEDPQKQKKALKLGRVWTEDDAYDPDKLDEANAKDEEAAFERGEAREIKDFDDDTTHAEYHLEAAKSRARLAYTLEGEDLKQFELEQEIRMQHAVAHIERAQEANMPPEGMIDPQEAMEAQGGPQ